ncbi:MAG: hypothetical protein ACOYBX_10370 [Mycobacterium sp.]
MPAVRDPDNAQWIVGRVWWPFGRWLAEITEGELLFMLALVVTAPLALIWPFWLLTRVFGMPWTVVVRRMGIEMHREKVSGWTASRERIADLLDQARSGGGPDLPRGVTVY